MLISSRNLNRLLPDLPEDSTEAAASLRRAGLDVQEILPLAELLREIVVGKVERVSAHPNADRLRICVVDVGGSDPLQIVTGADNVREGAFYPVIRSGVTLPNGTRIRRGKLRGEVSEGMLGSPDELELGDDHAGLLELDGSPQPGASLPDAVPVTGFVLRLGGVADHDELVAAVEGGFSIEVQIDVFADIACPWCLIADRRLANALGSRPDLRVVWRWRPYQLQPDLPPSGLSWERFVAQKFGDDAEPMLEQVREIAAADGIEMRFDRMARAANTLNAHRLILFAQERGLARETVDALFRAHFTSGDDVGDVAVLLGVAAQVGLDKTEVADHLASDRGIAAVEESQDVASRLGIGGVPFHIFNGRVAISGAQDTETFQRAIEMSLEDA